MKRRYVPLLFVFFLHCGSDVYDGPLHAGEGDRRFGTDGTGIVLLDLDGTDERPQAIALDTEQRILVAGSRTTGRVSRFMVARFLPDGAPDTSFGESGFATHTVGSASSYGVGMQRLDDGKIVVCGHTMSPSASVFSAVRFHSDGRVDESYGDHGVQVFADSPGRWIASACAADAKSRLFITGSEMAPHSAENVGLASLSSQGERRASHSTDFANGLGDRAFAIGIDPLSAVWLVGSGTFGSATEILVTKFNPETLSPEPDFAEQGMLRIDVGTPAAARAVLTRDDTTYVAAHTTNQEGFEKFTVFAVDSNGEVNASFGTGGFSILPVSRGHDRPCAMAFEAPDKLVIVGESQHTPGGASLAIVRLNLDGSIDREFANGGIKTIDLPSRVSIAKSLFIQPDGKILVVGESRDSNDYDLTMVRLNP